VGELFKNSVFRKLVVVCNGVGKGLMTGLNGTEPSLSSARVIFSACVNVVSWNSVFLIFRLKKIMTRLQNDDAQQSQRRKMNIDRKGE
jgi:hypothetical protein